MCILSFISTGHLPNKARKAVRFFICWTNSIKEQIRIILLLNSKHNKWSNIRSLLPVSRNIFKKLGLLWNSSLWDEIYNEMTYKAVGTTFLINTYVRRSCLINHPALDIRPERLLYFLRPSRLFQNSLYKRQMTLLCTLWSDSSQTLQD